MDDGGWQIEVIAQPELTWLEGSMNIPILDVRLALNLPPKLGLPSKFDDEWPGLIGAWAGTDNEKWLGRLHWSIQST
jgi:hypothetical protein